MWFNFKVKVSQCCSQHVSKSTTFALEANILYSVHFSQIHYSLESCWTVFAEQSVTSVQLTASCHGVTGMFVGLCVCVTGTSMIPSNPLTTSRGILIFPLQPMIAKWLQTSL